MQPNGDRLTERMGQHQLLVVVAIVTLVFMILPVGYACQMSCMQTDKN